ncbi:Ms4533A family Cys-rich leader peptide [Rhodococcus sp. CH91]|uniref:Ms4533A family Cys-rich leader peptide n=1 Tax=Rhodococcus sp. CH91 TaxID=2910256 RepID=UPI0035A98FB5
MTGGGPVRPVRRGRHAPAASRSRDSVRPVTSAIVWRVSATTLPRARHELALIAVGMPSVADIDCCR